jgi:hypothetical protein
VTWSALFGTFVLSHLVGDFLLQTNWQAMNKHGVALPHAAVDDGRFVRGWVRRVKGVHGAPPNVVRLGVDQTLHVLALGAVALFGRA